MNLGLENKPVLVMASTSGIGYAVALEFAKEKEDISKCVHINGIG